MADATFWTAAHLVGVIGAEFLSPSLPREGLAGLSIDTRTLQPGQVYVALCGENHDGHDFVDQAFEAGAAMAIVATKSKWAVAEGGGSDSSDLSHPRPTIVHVPDTLAALQWLAAAYRDHLRQRGCRVIAVAGSNGKTTTRHMIHAALSTRLRGTQSPKSFNNHIGVPLTLLGAGEEDDFVVVEIGTNHPGEVAALATMVRPDAAVIASIGHEHMEHFKTLENVAKEECSVFEFLEPDGLAVVPAAEAERLKPLGRDITTFDVDPAVPADLPLAGAHNRRNAAAAAAVARWFGLTDAEIAAGLRDLEPVPGRLQRLTFGGVTVLHDAYNANPDSMREALGVLNAECEMRNAELGNAIPHRRRVAILGDMLELGAAGPDLHRDIAGLIAELGNIDQVVTIGPLSMHTAEALRDQPGFTVTAIGAFTDQTPAQITALLEPADIVLLKASRGMKLERLLPAIEARFAGQSLEPQMNTDAHG